MGPLQVKLAEVDSKTLVEVKFPNILSTVVTLSQ